MSFCLRNGTTFFLITGELIISERKTVCDGIMRLEHGIILVFTAVKDCLKSCEERSCMMIGGGIMRRSTKLGYDDLIRSLPLKKYALQAQKRPCIVCSSGWWIT